MNSGLYNIAQDATTLLTALQPANVVLLGPSSGSPGYPSFRAMTATDDPIELTRLYGDGSDGDLTVTTSTVTSGPITSGVLQRDAFFNNLTISGAGAINCSVYRLFVRGVLTITAARASAIHANGNAGGNSTTNRAGAAGSATAIQTNGQSGAGSAGKAGVTGAGVAATAASQNTGDHTVTGGSGGAGGSANAGGTAGGNGASSTNTSLVGPLYRTILPEMIIYLGTSSRCPTGGNGGTGGASGAGDGTNAGRGGGGGAASGGFLTLAAYQICRGAGTSAGAIAANGGKGGDGGGSAAGNAGGGGGGGGGSGGTIWLLYHELLGETAPNCLSTSGGGGGAGSNAAGTGVGGTGGGGGGGGRIYKISANAATSPVTTTVGGASVAGSGPTGTTGGTGGTGVTHRMDL